MASGFYIAVVGERYAHVFAVFPDVFTAYSFEIWGIEVALAGHSGGVPPWGRAAAPCACPSVGVSRVVGSWPSIIRWVVVIRFFSILLAGRILTVHC